MTRRSLRISDPARKTHELKPNRPAGFAASRGWANFMKTIKQESVGEVLAAIYDSEIPIRLEWVWDGGFTWALITGSAEYYPRVWNDDSLDGATTAMQSDVGARAADAGQFLRKDWLARGSEETVQAAVARLGDAILKHLPASAFANQWRTSWPNDKVSHDAPTQ